MHSMAIVQMDWRVQNLATFLKMRSFNNRTDIGMWDAFFRQATICVKPLTTLINATELPIAARLPCKATIATMTTAKETRLVIVIVIGIQ